MKSFMLFSKSAHLLDYAALLVTNLREKTLQYNTNTNLQAKYKTYTLPYGFPIRNTDTKLN